MWSHRRCRITSSQRMEVLRLGCRPCWRAAIRVRNCDSVIYLSSSLAVLLGRIHIMLGKYQQTLHITLNSIISLGAGVPHAAVSRLSIDIYIRLLPGPIELITHICAGKVCYLYRIWLKYSTSPQLISKMG